MKKLVSAKSSERVERVAETERAQEPTPYESPEIERLGELSDLLGKTGPFTDGSVRNPTRPN